MIERCRPDGPIGRRRLVSGKHRGRPGIQLEIAEMSERKDEALQAIGLGAGRNIIKSDKA